MTIFNPKPHQGMQQIAGTFYRETPNALLVDTMMSQTQSTQTSLYKELQKYKELERQDMAYARLVAGTSTVSKNHQIWVLRNENSTHMTQHQLQYLQDAALTDLVRKRFMAANGSTVADMGQSVAEVVQSLNLEWEQFQLWGLHHVVEACECEVVMLLMQSGFLIKDPDIRSVAIRLRRCEDMCVPFALCVGAFICANQGLMTGATVTKVNGLRQEDHKLSLLRFMQDAITHNQESLYDCLSRQDPTDYVHRLSYINIVSPSKNIPDVVIQDEQSGTGGVSVQVGSGSQITDEVRRYVDKSIKTLQTAVDQELKNVTDQLSNKIDDLHQIVHQDRDNLTASNADLEQKIEETTQKLQHFQIETTKKLELKKDIENDTKMKDKTESTESIDNIQKIQSKHTEEIAAIQDKLHKQEQMELLINFLLSEVPQTMKTINTVDENMKRKIKILQDQIDQIMISLNSDPQSNKQPASTDIQTGQQHTDTPQPLPNTPQGTTRNPQNIQTTPPQESTFTPIKQEDDKLKEQAKELRGL